MLEHLFESVPALVHGRPVLAFAAVFAGGLVSAASPCVLAAVPLVIGYVGGYSDGDRRRAAYYSLLFVLGLSITFTLLGVAASAAGSYLARYGAWVFAGLSVLVVAMGLSLMGVFEMPALAGRAAMPKRKGALGALLMGLIVGVASSPCATPVLAVVLAYVASEGDIAYGGALLFVYAVGHCALIFFAGVSVGFANRLVNSRYAAGGSQVVRKLSGAVLVCAGAYIFVDTLI